MATPIEPLTAVNAALPSPAAAPAMAGPTPHPGVQVSQSLLATPLQALHQAAQAPDAVGRGVRASASSRTSRSMKVVRQLSESLIAPGSVVELQPDVAAADAAEMPGTEASVKGLERVSQFAIQTSVQLASESMTLSITSALASAANTTFHELLNSNE